MNFDFDDDQHHLKDEARRFLTARCNSAVVRGILDDPNREHDAGLWMEIAGQGWIGAALPEPSGGLGLGYITLCALATELGRAVAPIPFSSTVYRFAEALQLVGDHAVREEILPAIATGEQIGTVALAEGAGDPLVAGVSATVRDRRLYGTKYPVVDGGIADWAVVLADDRLWLAKLDDSGVKREALPSLDPTRGLSRIEFDGVPVRPLGEEGGGTALADLIENRAAVMIAFEQLGGAERCLEMAVDYAKQRYAFGRPIGSYQAIKHRLADMAIKIEVLRANAYYAAWALETGAPELARAACAARIAGSDAYWFAAREGLHVHGGIGFTWELDCHLHYRRAQFLNLMLGPPARWKRKLADLIDQSADGQHHGL